MTKQSLQESLGRGPSPIPRWNLEVQSFATPFQAACNAAGGYNLHFESPSLKQSFLPLSLLCQCYCKWLGKGKGTIGTFLTCTCSIRWRQQFIFKENKRYKVQLLFLLSSLMTSSTYLTLCCITPLFFSCTWCIMLLYSYCHMNLDTCIMMCMCYLSFSETGILLTQITRLCQVKTVLF